MFDIQTIALIAQVVIIGLMGYWFYRKLRVHEREIIGVKNELVRMQNIFETQASHFIHDHSDYEPSINGEDSEAEQRAMKNRRLAQQQQEPSMINPINSQGINNAPTNLMFSKEFSFPMGNMTNMLQSLNPLMNKVLISNLNEDGEDDEEDENDENESNASQDDGAEDSDEDSSDEDDSDEQSSDEDNQEENEEEEKEKNEDIVEENNEQSVPEVENPQKEEIVNQQSETESENEEKTQEPPKSPVIKRPPGKTVRGRGRGRGRASTSRQQHDQD